MKPRHKIRHIAYHYGRIDRKERERRNGHRGGVFWLTGLSGSGKSTVAHSVEEKLVLAGFNAFAFDGDNIRHGLCADLSFSKEARAENIRRIAELTKLFVQNGTICLCAFISPFQCDRDRVRDIVGDDYHEIFTCCPLSVCEERDVKGYYKLARDGKIKGYTGISSPYEEPEFPELMLKTNVEDLEQSVETVFNYILEKVTFDPFGDIASYKNIQKN